MAALPIFSNISKKSVVFVSERDISCNIFQNSHKSSTNTWEKNLMYERIGDDNYSRY